MSTRINTSATDQGVQGKELATFEQKITLTGLVRRSNSTPGVGVEGIKHPKHAELDAEGYAFAQASKSIIEEESHKEVLGTRAKAAVGEIELGPFDPFSNPSDRETMKKQERLEKDRDEVKEQLRVAEGSALDVQAAAVDSQAPARPRPEEPGAVIVLSAGFLAIPLFPTVFDYWEIGDPLLHWTTAVLLSLCIGFAVAKLLFYTSTARGEETSSDARIGLFIAIGVALGFGVVRVALAGTYWIAAGLTLLELFIILAIELVAQRYRRSVHGWDEQQHAHQKATQRVALQSGRVEELQQRLAGIHADLEIIEEGLYIRHLLATQPEKVERSFAGSILAGYARGIAQNKAEYEAHVRR
jgi:hypothetical protein